jgi:hypothetical protein
MRVACLLFVAILATSAQTAAAKAQEKSGFDEKALDQCLSRVGKKKDSPTDDDCLRQATAAAEAAPATAMAAARAVRKRFNPYVAMPLFRMAVEGKPKSVCDDSELQQSMTAALGLPKDDKRAEDARHVAFESCWPAFKDALVGQLEHESAGSYFADNACSGLKKHQALSTAAAANCAAGAP